MVRAMANEDLEPILRKNILAMAAVYAAAVDRAVATVSLLAFGDSQFLDQVQDGKRAITARKYDAGMRKLRSLMPPGTKLPKLNEPWRKNAAGRDQKKPAGGKNRATVSAR